MGDHKTHRRRRVGLQQQPLSAGCFLLLMSSTTYAQTGVDPNASEGQQAIGQRVPDQQILHHGIKAI